MHTVTAGDGHERGLGLVQRPVGGEVATVLVRVRVADHHLLAVAVGAHVGAVPRLGEQRVERGSGVVEVVDRLEQRHDVDVEPGFLGEHGDFEHVAHRAAGRDDVVGHGRRTDAVHAVGGGGHDRQLARGALAVGGPRHLQRAGAGQLGQEHPAAVVFAERGVRVRHSGAGEQLGDRLLVHRRVLAQVEPAQVEPEQLDVAAHRFDERGRHRRRAVAGERGGHHVEVAHQVGRRVVRVALVAEDRRGHTADRQPRRRREAPLHAAQRAPVGLVRPERRVVARRVGEVDQRDRRVHQPGRHRQLDGQRSEGVEVVGEGDRRLPVEGVPDHVGGDERVAVTVAADPGAHADDRRQRVRRQLGPAPHQLAPGIGLQRADRREEREVVVAERLVDLVTHA